MLKGLYQIAAVSTVVVLASLGVSSAKVLPIADDAACKAEAGEATYFVFNGKCYVSDDTAEVVKRDDLTTAGTCYNRCETDAKCGAPYFDTSVTPVACFHYTNK